MTSSTAQAQPLTAVPPVGTHDRPAPPRGPRRARGQTLWIWLFLLPTVVLYGA